MIENPYTQFLTNNPFPRHLRQYHLSNAGSGGRFIQYNGRELLNFSSNDYLGLAHHPALIERSREWAMRWGAGASSSRLVAGNYSLYDALETQLARCLNKEAAFILGAGFQTNVSVLEALLDQTVLGHKPIVLCDRLSHASMMVPVMAKTEFYRFQHNDMDHLKKLLEKQAKKARPLFILAESLYSMEGDFADLRMLSELAAAFNAFLYIDDAHAVGLYGKDGWGLAPAEANSISMIMGTFSKALGSYGAYIGCSYVMKKYLINKCKGLIYSTALPPSVLGAISAAIDLMPTLTERRQKLMQHIQFFHEKLNQLGIKTDRFVSPIIPWVLGCAEKTLRASRLLEEEGILALPIRPPTVLPNRSRIRFCLSAAHTEQDISNLINAIQKVEGQL